MLVDSVDRVLIANSEKPLDAAFHLKSTCQNDRSFEPHFLPVPTNEIPGTLEKVAILRARMETGMILHHPEDCLSVR